eukprot:4986748-Amphidinium_carterae.1
MTPPHTNIMMPVCFLHSLLEGCTAHSVLVVVAVLRLMTQRVGVEWVFIQTFACGHIDGHVRQVDAIV